MIEHEPDPLRRIPTKRPLDVHAEVGPILHAARLKRGQSLEAVAQQTRIPKRYLEALEADRLDEFPAFVYMRGFLNSYCEYLDLSFDQLWAQVQPPPATDASSAAAPNAAPAHDAPAAPAALPARAPAPTHTPPPAHAPAAPHAPEPGGSSAAGAVLFASALAVLLIVWLIKDRGPAPTAHPAPSTPRALMPLPRTLEPSKIGLRAVDDAWVRVTVDDAVVFEGRLPRGAAMDWKPSHFVSLRTTAASSLQLTVNGVAQTLANPSPDGDYRVDVP